MGVGTTRTGMRAARIAAPGDVRFERVQLPEPAPREVRFRVQGCGVSRTRAWEQPGVDSEPGASGPEGWGVVDAVGTAVESLKLGDRIAALSTHAFAEFDVVDEGAAVVLPESLVDQPFPGAALGGAMNVIAQSSIHPGQNVAVVGVGFLGALLVQLAARAGAHVIALSRRPFSLSLAREMGASSVVEIETHAQAVHDMRQLTYDKLCDRVLEATGEQAGISLGMALVSRRGTFVIAGRHTGARAIDLEQWAARGCNVVNAHDCVEMAAQGMRAAMRLMQSAELETASLCTHEYRLEQLAEALEVARQRPVGLIKALITV